jgi:hypothetical protein
MDTLGELNTERWVGAARRYVRFRRCFWRFFLCGFAIVVVFGVPLTAAGEYIPRPLQALLFSALWLIVLVCWVGFMMSMLALWGFHCPRCRGRFAISWFSNWPTDRCKHCGLNLRQVESAAGERR